MDVTENEMDIIARQRRKNEPEDRKGGMRQEPKKEPGRKRERRASSFFPKGCDEEGELTTYIHISLRRSYSFCHTELQGRLRFLASN